MPNATPRIIDKMVSTSVFFAPLITGAEKALSLMNDHWNAGFVNSMCTNIADNSTTTALATHRPGCRTGIALTSARVGAVGVVVSVIVSPGLRRRRRVDLGVAHRPVADVPGVEDLLVRA